MKKMQHEKLEKKLFPSETSETKVVVEVSWDLHRSVRFNKATPQNWARPIPLELIPVTEKAQPSKVVTDIVCIVAHLCGLTRYPCFQACQQLLQQLLVDNKILRAKDFDNMTSNSWAWLLSNIIQGGHGYLTEKN